MEKDKASRKKSSEKYAASSLPVPPPDPSVPRNDLPEAFRRIIGYEEREAAFLRTLQATIDEEERQRGFRLYDDGSEGAVGGENDGDVSLAQECDTFIRPLLARTGPSISAALVTEGAIDQLDKLHGILEHLLHMQEQTYRLRRCTRDVDTLTGVKAMQMQISRDPEAFLAAHPESLDAENELEMEYNEMLLLAAGNSASSKRSSSKKQRMRSKSVANPPDDHALQLTPDRDLLLRQQYPLRRQSAITDIKAKVSKWTKVKAAFKWERANPSLNENGKSTDSGIGLSPINNEVARYLRVPSSPIGGGGGGAGSSADSVLSYSSGGHVLSGGSSNPATPGTLSSASSIDDVRPLSDDYHLLAPKNNDDSRNHLESSSRSITDCLSGGAADQDDTRRTRSLDGETTTHCSNFLQQYDKNCTNQTPWRKVKDIIKTHGGSLRIKTRHRASPMVGGCSNGRNSPVANCIPVSIINTTPHTQSAITSHISTSISIINPTNATSYSCPSSSSFTQPLGKNYPLLKLTAPPFVDSTALVQSAAGSQQSQSFDLPTPPTSAKSLTSSGRGSTRRPKAIHDICCLPEGQPLDMSTVTHRGTPSGGSSSGRPPPSPLNVLASRQTSNPDSSDPDQLDQRCSPLTVSRQHFNWTTSLTRSRKSVGSTSLSGRNVSAPSSPSQKFEFFGEFESEDLSSGDFSEPCTPHTKLSPKTSLTPQDEINRKYHELQQQISLEFQAKQKEWERIRNSSIAGGAGATNSSSAQLSPQRDDFSNSGRDLKSSPTPTKPVEDNLTADFKKKLQEWRIKQSQSTLASSPTKEADKKIDWHLWKTGQLKLEGQGLKQMPDEKDLPEEFQRKLDEWKRIKATGSATNAESSSTKRQSLKSNQLLKSDTSSTKKLKCSVDDLVVKATGEREKLFRLKSLAEPKPAKEVVVQTTKGALKFEGISRKFTQKLYEWEKARGIGPEASTFALLHPGYRPLVVGNGEVEVSLPATVQQLPMGRSLSMDSISPHASAPSIISHQHSSLSLNNVDDLIDTKTSKKGCGFGSSNSDLDLDGDDDDDELPADEEEPEAVIVEVEDDYVETAASLFTASPMIEKQTPIYRYEQTRKEYYAGKKEAVFHGESKPTIAVAASQALKNATKMVTSLKEVRHGFKANILHVQTVLRSLVETLPTLKSNLQENSERLRESVDVVQNMAINIIEKLTELEETVSSKEDLDARMTLIDGQLSILRKALNFVCKHTASRKTSRNEDLPAITFTSDSPIPPERNIAVVSLAPIIFQGQVIINQVQVHEDRSKCIDPDSENVPVSPYHISDCDSGNRNTTTDTTLSSAPAQVSESEVKKLTRNLSNGAKRKTKLRRMGSRQNSKTESDSDDDPQNVVLDAPRRVKRKTSKAKRLAESNSLDKADEQSTPALATGDDVVYTLKLKSGKPIEQIEVPFDFSQQPEPDPLEILENLSVENFHTASNVFVKTKRRIFSPSQNHAGAVVSKEIETSSASDRRDSEPKTPEIKLVTNLPPLPQSPGQQRRSEPRPSSKEPSPAIRIMIAKYNQRLSVERRNSSPLNSSGSCSPVAWRSPVLERRVRAQAENQANVVKSLSAGNVGRDLKLSEATTILDTDAAISKLVKGVLKSSSAGILSENWYPPDDEDIDCAVSLACDSLKKISLSRSECRQYIGNEDKPEGMFRKNSTKFSLPKKISAKHIRDVEVTSTEKYTNTLPKITRKYDAAKPPSPRSARKPAKVCLELNIRNANLMPTSDIGPDTPLSDRALKLKRAKEDFLKMSAGYRSICPPGEDIWQNRISQISAGSETSAEELKLIKSASVGMINESGKRTQSKNSDKGARKPSSGFGGFVSLPRNSTRTSKSQGSMFDPVNVSPSNSTSKFGFSSIAHKFKMVKLRRNSKDFVNNVKMNTVTRLCRQSLMVDLPQGGAAAGPSGCKESKTTCEVQKSGSAHSMGLGSLLFRRMDRSEKLKKSKSIGQLNNNNSGGG